MSTMTLLQLCSEFCRRTGLTVPTKVMESTDETVLQIAALANEILEDLAERHSWSTVTYSVTFISVAAESQGLLTTLAPNAFLKVQNNTIWDRTLRLPVWGPLDPVQWQELQALPNAGPLYRYRIQEGLLKIYPTIEAGHTMAFDYTSCGLVQATGGGAIKEYFTADTDVFLLPAKLLLQGMRWKWRSEKGLPYAENFKTYEAAVAEAMGSDGTKPVLNMAGGNPNIQPGIWVPAGSWNV